MINLNNGYEVRTENGRTNVVVTQSIVNEIMRDPYKTADYLQLMGQIVYAEKIRRPTVPIIIDATEVPRDNICDRLLAQFVIKSRIPIKVRIEGGTEGTELWCPNLRKAEDGFLDEILRGK